MSVKDFDQAWDEKNEQGHPFKVKGREYELPPSIPAKVMLESLRLQEEYDTDDEIPNKKAIDIAIDLLGKDNVDQMMDDGITVNELTDIIQWSNEIYTNPDDEEADGSGNAN